MTDDFHELSPITSADVTDDVLVRATMETSNSEESHIRAAIQNAPQFAVEGMRAMMAWAMNYGRRTYISHLPPSTPADHAAAIRAAADAFNAAVEAASKCGIVTRHSTDGIGINVVRIYLPQDFDDYERDVVL